MGGGGIEEYVLRHARAHDTQRTSAGKQGCAQLARRGGFAVRLVRHLWTSLSSAAASLAKDNWPPRLTGASRDHETLERWGKLQMTRTEFNECRDRWPSVERAPIPQPIHRSARLRDDHPH